MFKTVLEKIWNINELSFILSSGESCMMQMGIDPDIGEIHTASYMKSFSESPRKLCDSQPFLESVEI